MKSSSSKRDRLSLSFVVMGKCLGRHCEPDFAVSGRLASQLEPSDGRRGK